MVEFAVCLPVLSFIILASMETVGVIRAAQGVVEATHETARMVAATEIDAIQAQKFATDMLKLRKLEGAHISFRPPPSPDIPRGTPVTVTISVPVSGNCTIISGLFADRTLGATSTISRELGSRSHQIVVPPRSSPKRKQHKG